jgi:Ribbon-helix-helix protein, copG family
MRTTVTLDDDLAIRLERLSQEQGRNFKSVINEAIRAGLEALQQIPQQRTSEAESYTEPVDLGPVDLGPPARTELTPSELLALADHEEDNERFGVPG